MDAAFSAPQNLSDLSGGVALLIEEVDRASILRRQRFYRFPDKGQILPFLSGQCLVRLIRMADMVVIQPVFA